MRKGQRFARAFKRAVAVEYLQSGEERKVIALKYGLPSVQTVSNWVSLYLTPHEIETKRCQEPVPLACGLRLRRQVAVTHLFYIP